VRNPRKNKKSLPFIHASDKIREPIRVKNKNRGKMKKVLTRFWRFSYKWRFTLEIPSTS